MFLIVNTKECKDNAFRYSECYVLTQTLPTWSHTLNKFWHLSYPHPTIFGHHANSSQLCIDTVHYIIWLYLASNTTNADMHLHKRTQCNRSSRTHIFKRQPKISNCCKFICIFFSSFATELALGSWQQMLLRSFVTPAAFNHEFRRVSVIGYGKKQYFWVWFAISAFRKKIT